MALFNINSVQNNTQVLESAHNWNILLIKDPLLITQKMPKLNYHLKVFKYLQLLN